MSLFRETLYAGGPGVERGLCAPIISRIRPLDLQDRRGKAQDMSLDEGHLIAVLRS